MDMYAKWYYHIISPWTKMMLYDCLNNFMWLPSMFLCTVSKKFWRQWPPITCNRDVFGGMASALPFIALIHPTYNWNKYEWLTTLNYNVFISNWRHMWPVMLQEWKKLCRVLSILSLRQHCTLSSYELLVSFYTSWNQ